MLDAAGVAREAEARRRAGFEIELLKPAQVEDPYGIKGRHAIVGYGNYSADPRRLAAGNLNVALSRGARLYAPVDICNITPSAVGVTLRSKDGPAFRAKHLVVATGYKMMKGIPRKGNKIISSWSSRPARSPALSGRPAR